jgi:hypothetical protein
MAAWWNLPVSTVRIDFSRLTKQNMLSQLPGVQAVFEFGARGIQYMPGGATVDFQIGKQVPSPGAETDQRLFRVQINDEVSGCLIVRLNKPDAFEPYRSYVGNLCFMMAAVLQQHRRTEAERDRQQELECRVGERTKQPAQMVLNRRRRQIT